jgi:carboxylesterase
VKPYDASHFNHDRCRPFLHEGGPKGLLLLHGFTGSVAHMRPLGDALAHRGYTVMGINLPGHATTEKDLAKTGREQWLAAARDALLLLRGRCATVVAAGLSMGGLLSLILAEEKLTDACVALSAPMAVQNRLFYLSDLIAPFKPRVSWAPPDERHSQLNASYDYGYSGFPSRKIADVRGLMRAARGNLAAIVCPLLAVQGTADQTVWPGSADFILNGAGSAVKRKLTPEGAPHVCTLSEGLPLIVDAMDELMEKL